MDRKIIENNKMLGISLKDKSKYRVNIKRVFNADRKLDEALYSIIKAKLQTNLA